jgi:hypothetical protein
MAEGPLSTFRLPDNFVPVEEGQILGRVAEEYQLTPQQMALLYSIRRQENGGPGREMGVLNPEAERFKGDFPRSLETQAKWAAGTIKKRFDGDIKKFGSRWAPLKAKNDPTNLNKNWVPGIERFMAQTYFPEGYGQ